MADREPADQDGASRPRAWARLQKRCAEKSGEYTSTRIARSVMWAYGPVRSWGATTVDQLKEVSADQGHSDKRGGAHSGKKSGFFDQLSGSARVADLASQHGCPAELLSMHYCLGGGWGLECGGRGHAANPSLK